MTGFFLSSNAVADVWTGYSVPVAGPIGACSVPPANFDNSAEVVQVSSVFTYLACREYRDSKTHSVYFLVTEASDGEYIRMLPRPGAKTLDGQDYRAISISAGTTCANIREQTLSNSVELAKTPCGSLPQDI